MTQLVSSDDLKKNLKEDVAKLRELLAKSDAADGDLSGLIIGVHVGVGTCSQRSVAAPSEVADALALLWSVATDEKRGPSVRLNSIGVLASAISMDDGCYTRAVDTDLLKSAIDFLGTLSTADRASESNVALTINTTVLIQSLTQNANKQCESAIGKGVLPILRELLSHPQPHVVEAAADMCCQLGASGDEAKKSIAAAGMIPPLAHILVTTGDQETLCKVLLVIGMLCGGADTAAQGILAECAGALRKIILLTRTSADEDVKVISRDLFKALGKNEALRDKLATALRETAPGNV